MVRRVIQEDCFENKALKRLEIGMPEPLESPPRIEPCWLENIPLELGDLIADLTSASERLGSRLPPHTAANLADLVRVMNCYYSNLIEGHHTKPREIERAGSEARGIPHPGTCSAQRRDATGRGRTDHRSQGAQRAAGACESHRSGHPRFGNPQGTRFLPLSRGCGGPPVSTSLRRDLKRLSPVLAH